VNAGALRSGAFSLALCLVALSLTGAPAPAQGDLYSAQELDTMLGPIALYPDPLLSQVLAAAAFPDQIKEAAALVPSQGASAIAAQNWDPSVKAVAGYPEVLQMLAGSPDWTAALGWAALKQQADVLASVQRLRRQAQEAGNLASTPQQKVITDDQVVQIVPAQPNVIYVPQYDPAVVYVDRGPTFGEVATASLISFGVGYAFGSWSYNTFDWHHHSWNYSPRPPYPPGPRPPYHGGYPGYRPGGYPPGTRPPGTRPPGMPGTRPPGTRPPTIPGTRPPGTRPPTTPATRPPGTRPPVARPPTPPGGRPTPPVSRPGARPTPTPGRPTPPVTRPTPRPGPPVTRPAAPSVRPDFGRPSARPQPSAGSAFGGYQRSGQAQQLSARGHRSLGGMRGGGGASRAPSMRSAGGGRRGGGGGGRRR